ncbi:MAG TPA: adenylate/guanylate cyclase domain-containing protein [Nitrososphaeraceae archaeon]|nr:adenylate/guanylate cyclase domain-containing protein [Nitrososphaeraceae archaeon]
MENQSYYSLKTDKTEYVSGETIKISGTTNNSTINIQVYDPSDRLLSSVFLDAYSNNFTYHMKLSNKNSSGNYKIRSILDDRQEKLHKIKFFADNYGDIEIMIPGYNEPKTFSKQICAISSENVKITWKNMDSELHTATSFDQHTGMPDGKFDTGFIGPHNVSTLTIHLLNNEKIYYFCKLHPWEKGVLYRGDWDASSNDLHRFDSVHQTISKEETKKLNILLRHLDPSEIDSLKFDNVSNITTRLLTIVFWDISGFSKACRPLDVSSDLLLNFLKDYFDTAKEIISKYGGLRDKFIGDGVMALFGMQRREYDGAHIAKNAVLAALEFRTKFQDIKSKWMDQWKRFILDLDDLNNIDLKCGINTGRVISGNLGALCGLDQITAIGTHVNLASRFCDLAKGGQILVSSTTKNHIERSFEINHIGKYPIKNIGNYDVFEIIGTSSLEQDPVIQVLELGHGEVVDWKIPSKIVRGEPTKIFAKFLGSVDFGFFTFCITDSIGQVRFFEDKSSIDTYLNIGKLHVKNDIYLNEWEFTIPTYLKPGKCKAEVAMYEDTNRLMNERNRVAFAQKEILLV